MNQTLDEAVKELEKTIQENDLAIKGLQKEIEIFKKSSILWNRIGYIIFGVVIFLVMFLW